MAHGLSCGPQSVFINKVLLQHSHVHSLMCCLWLCSSCNDRAEWLQQRLHGLRHRKHLLSGPLPQCSWALGLEEGIRITYNLQRCMCFTHVQVGQMYTLINLSPTNCEVLTFCNVLHQEWIRFACIDKDQFQMKVAKGNIQWDLMLGTH